LMMIRRSCPSLTPLIIQTKFKNSSETLTSFSFRPILPCRCPRGMLTPIVGSFVSPLKKTWRT
jgi:hypothetical protein